MGELGEYPNDMTLEQGMRIEDYVESMDDADSLFIGEYDITSVPSDFNIMTLKNLVDRGWVRIPGFQRNFVWNRGRASKLIESLILGLPVPQIFLYEKERNTHLVIDGQQRLMSIYYYMEQRFPRMNKRGELRRMFDKHGKIPDYMLKEDNYFEDFKLQLPKNLPHRNNRLQGLTYEYLEEDDKSRLDLRPVRCIVIKQNAPQNNNSSMYEIFNRLNSGGMNLHPQEIRTSMYHSRFYDMLARINMNPKWREFLHSPEPDLHMKDVEVLLRGFAMLVAKERYAPSMARFLNGFSSDCEKNDDKGNQYLENLFKSFIGAMPETSTDIFFRNGRFNMALYEAVFFAVCRNAYESGCQVNWKLDQGKVNTLAEDREFIEASQRGTATTVNVQKRLERALHILGTNGNQYSE